MFGYKIWMIGASAAIAVLLVLVINVIGDLIMPAYVPPVAAVTPQAVPDTPVAADSEETVEAASEDAKEPTPAADVQVTSATDDAAPAAVESAQPVPSDDAAVAASEPAVASASAVDGAAIFKKQCKKCHRLSADMKKGVGPNLYHVVGRTAGTIEGFRYSDVMKESGLTWDAATLDQYLADPKGFLPKNKMAFKGLKDAEERAAVIAHIQSVK